MKLTNIRQAIHFLCVSHLSGAVALPQGTPGDPPASPGPPTSPNDWKTLKCTIPAVTDATQNPSIRWKGVDADDAWKAALEYASTTANPAQLSFSQLISQFFHGPDNMHCELPNARDTCATAVLCKDPPAGYAAGFLILNSFVEISNLTQWDFQLNYNIYDAVYKAQDYVTTQIAGFSETFAPIKQPTDALKVILDIVGLGFAVALAPVWNAALKALPWFKANGNALGTIKDTINPSISNGITLIKDGGLTGKIEVTNTLEENVGEVVKAWTATLNTLNGQLFNGSTSSTDDLFGQISDGKVLESGYTLDESEVETAIEKAIYGYLVPRAWSLSNEDLHAVVVDSGLPCTPPVIAFPINLVDEKYISGDVQAKTSTCVDGISYYLVMASGSGLDCPENPVGFNPCPTKPLLQLPGEESLDGTHWGGLTHDDLIAGAVATYKKNNNANGAPEIDAGSPDAVSDIYDNGIRAAGITTIPVCKADEAWNNWQKQAKTPNYPCN
ncbi:uncharacterized protein KY384_004788 [Bacidia gigantensis]|uniref:uncharacterized protein n=1 Tax=Bacidia gigantensis TaxID=2732470 RepID=UPI001D050765|nr:uncharacterized protein KY384_004788 [Bacidia gigantensis]KAG8530286.1 hypothetical protein KY384_004788 [Bacidia gigantensis]